MEERLIQKKSDVSRTLYGKSIYCNLWYCDKKNKICITFTPRGGCSIVFQQYLDLVGLLEDGLAYNSFIHLYRAKIFNKIIPCCNINQLVNEKYTFIKFIMNPYIRAVSIYRAHTSHNLSFREYMKALVNGQIEFLNNNDKYHIYPQYIDGEEYIITKYVKIDKYEKLQIPLLDGTQYTLDVNKYTSIHHGKKNAKNVSFCGDLSLRTVSPHNLPKTYKYFYDDEIKKMVDIFYKQDIEHYGYSFDDDF